MCPATYPSPFSPQVSLQCQASAHIQHPRSRTCPKTLAGLRLPRGPRQHASAQAQGSPVSARASDATGLPGAWLWKVPVPGVGRGRVGAATRPPPTMSCGLVVCADGRRWVPGVGCSRVGVSCTRLAVPGGLVTHRVQAPTHPHTHSHTHIVLSSKPETLVVSHSTCPPLSPSPHANSFVIGPAVINNNTHRYNTGTTHRCI